MLWRVIEGDTRTIGRAVGAAVEVTRWMLAEHDGWGPANRAMEDLHANITAAKARRDGGESEAAA